MKSKIFLNLRFFLRNLPIFSVLILFDQGVKEVIRTFFENGYNGLNHIYTIVPNAFDLVYLWNYGISFGMFGDFENTNIVMIFVVLVILCILFLISAYSEEERERKLIFFVMAGAVGNLIDRIRFGAVFDFLDFYIGKYHWPAFNVADTIIFISVFMMIFKKYNLGSNQSKSKVVIVLLAALSFSSCGGPDVSSENLLNPPVPPFVKPEGGK